MKCPPLKKTLGNSLCIPVRCSGRPPLPSPRSRTRGLLSQPHQTLSTRWLPSYSELRSRRMRRTPVAGASHIDLHVESRSREREFELIGALITDSSRVLSTRHTRASCATHACHAAPKIGRRFASRSPDMHRCPPQCCDANVRSGVALSSMRSASDPSSPESGVHGGIEPLRRTELVPAEAGKVFRITGPEPLFDAWIGLAVKRRSRLRRTQMQQRARTC
jgi:hypothetical protein